MIAIPEFLLKQMYVGGSLRQTENGIAFDIMNRLGPGLLTGVNGFKLDDKEFGAETITIQSGDKNMEASEISDENPISSSMGETVTCNIAMDEKIDPGFYSLTLDVVSKEAGQVTLTVKDQLS